MVNAVFSNQFLFLWGPCFLKSSKASAMVSTKQNRINFYSQRNHYLTKDDSHDGLEEHYLGKMENDFKFQLIRGTLDKSVDL